MIYRTLLFTKDHQCERKEVISLVFRFVSHYDTRKTWEEFAATTSIHEPTESKDTHAVLCIDVDYIAGCDSLFSFLQSAHRRSRELQHAVELTLN